MLERRDYRALEWVAGELGESLQQAREALSTWLDNRDDTTRLRFYLSHIHQVAGGLRMVEFSAPALLAEALERCAQALLDGTVPAPLRDDAAHALQSGLEVLEQAIAALRSHRRGRPLELMVAINDLRAVIQRPLVSETVLFSPRWAMPVSVPDTALMRGEELTEVARKLRQMYQIALTQLLRDEQAQKNLNYLAKVAARLVKLSGGGPQEPLWKVLIAVCEGLLNGAIALGPAVHVLLRQIDGQLKALVERGEATLRDAPPPALVRNLLFYVAMSPGQSRFIGEIRQQYALDQSLCTDANHPGVAAALAEQLRRLAADTQAGSAQWLHCADALALLDRARLLAQFREQALRRHRGREVSTDVLLAMADTLSQPAAEVAATPLFNDSEEAQEHLDSAFAAISRESRNALEQAKEAIVEFVASQWRHESLTDVPRLLAEVRGSLIIAGLGRAADVLSACEHFVTEELLERRRVPGWQLLDTLADAITSVDYYLEHLEEQDTERSDSVLGLAEQSVRALSENRPSAEVIPFQPSPAAGVDEPQLDDAEPATAPGPAADGVPDETEPPEQTPVVESSQQPSQENASQEDASAQAARETELAPEELVTQEGGADTAAAQGDEGDEEDAVDPELAEIFVEEAGEVLEELDALLPDWSVDPSAADPLGEVRRAFHTLKGSGRMVGAEAIGELAWSVENMLNRVIEGSLVIDPARVELVRQVRALVPQMVDAFAGRGGYDTDRARDLRLRAEALGGEQTPASAQPADNGSSPSEAPVTTDGDAMAVDTDTDTDTEGGADTGRGAEVSASDDADNGGEEIDSVLLEIFAGEADTHLQVLDEFLAEVAHGDSGYSDDLQRALHTLKGSAYMAGVTPIAAVVKPIEQLVKELRIARQPLDAEVLGLVTEATGLIRQGVAQLDSAPLQPLPGADEFIDRVEAVTETRLAELEGVDGERDQPPEPEVVQRFLAEAIDQVSAVGDDLVRWRDGDDSRRATLAGTLNQVADSAGSLDQAAVEEVSQSLQSLLRRGDEHSQLPGAAFFSLAQRGVEHLIQLLDGMAVQQPAEVDEALLAELQDFEFDDFPGEAVSVPKRAPEESSSEELSGPGEPEVEPEVDPDSEPEIDPDHEPEVDPDDEPEIDPQWEPEVDPDSPPELTSAREITTSAESPAGESGISASEGEPSESGTGVWPDETGDGARAAWDNGVEAAAAPPVGDDPAGHEGRASEAGEFSASSLYGSAYTDQDAATEGEGELVDPEAVTESEAAEDAEVDAEILEIFLEEADDLLEAVDEAIHGWQGAPQDTAYLDDLQRLLHTFKGGARLAGLVALGNLAHNFETLLINTQTQALEPGAELMGAVVKYQDQLVAGVDAIKREGRNAAVGEIEESEPEGPSSADTPQPLAPATVSEGVVIPFSRPPEPDPDEFEAPPAPDPSSPSASAPAREVPWTPDNGADTTSAGAWRRGPQEVVKVSSQLLENLVNLAGETSIARSRAEEQVSELVFALDEMQITVDRLQEQVRRLDLETEAQILFRQEQVESEGLDGFDPLELDRYSMLQQLSRSLLESASDLIDIKSTLGDKSRDMEQLLVQQSRINTELQEGLMRSRMVPFSRMVPRLRRIVRQVAGELDKRIEFLVDNAEGELDRTVLEKIVAPLEHMLRNAVDHGIEPVEQRRAAGKPETGTIMLGLAREGGEVVLRLSDDGGGVDLEAVREKAIERGLMNPDASLTDHEVLQFILAAGFSTAKQVTQISGRGVGMDVVHSEIKQLGGSVEIDSRPGAGTYFTVRLPFTVSVNRALMVQVAGDTYAIPLNTIEGIVRVSPFELEAYYQPEAPLFEYAGQEYLMRYLGALLHTADRPLLDGQMMPLPVILVRGSDHAVAVQVDGLSGSREIVVKSLGPQFAQVQGLSGATVLGDGSVVVILDLLAMIRKDASHLHRDFVLDEDERRLPFEQRPLLVMVVDDSVTVRKVTSRFLERQGMEVVVAKDGMDAITQLQEVDQVPDIMLLDIEMPRMDGYEVAGRIRHTNRLKDMPIIMITSRTGEKHRERAMSLGVNRYLGKPYQETVLLESIFELTGREPEPLLE